MFTSDLSGIYLTPGLARKVMNLKSGRGFPDLLIFKKAKRFNGLFLELKKTGEKLLNKSGVYKTEHLKEQAMIISKLNNQDYFACFAIGYVQAIRIIDAYMHDNLEFLESLKII